MDSENTETMETERGDEGEKDEKKEQQETFVIHKLKPTIVGMIKITQLLSNLNTKQKQKEGRKSKADQPQKLNVPKLNLPIGKAPRLRGQLKKSLRSGKTY